MQPARGAQSAATTNGKPAANRATGALQLVRTSSIGSLYSNGGSGGSLIAALHRTGCSMQTMAQHPQSSTVMRMPGECGSGLMVMSGISSIFRRLKQVLGKWPPTTTRMLSPGGTHGGIRPSGGPICTCSTNGRPPAGVHSAATMNSIGIRRVSVRIRPLGMRWSITHSISIRWGPAGNIPRLSGIGNMRGSTRRHAMLSRTSVW